MGTNRPATIGTDKLYELENLLWSKLHGLQRDNQNVNVSDLNDPQTEENLAELANKIAVTRTLIRMIRVTRERVADSIRSNQLISGILGSGIVPDQEDYVNQCVTEALGPEFAIGEDDYGDLLWTGLDDTVELFLCELGGEDKLKGLFRILVIGTNRNHRHKFDVIGQIKDILEENGQVKQLAYLLYSIFKDDFTSIKTFLSSEGSVEQIIDSFAVFADISHFVEGHIVPGLRMSIGVNSNSTLIGVTRRIAQSTRSGEITKKVFNVWDELPAVIESGITKGKHPWIATHIDPMLDNKKLSSFSVGPNIPTKLVAMTFLELNHRELLKVLRSAEETLNKYKEWEKNWEAIPEKIHKKREAEIERKIEDMKIRNPDMTGEDISEGARRIREDVERERPDISFVDHEKTRQLQSELQSSYLALEDQFESNKRLLKDPYDQPASEIEDSVADELKRSLGHMTERSGLRGNIFHDNAGKNGAEQRVVDINEATFGY